MPLEAATGQYTASVSVPIACLNKKYDEGNTAIFQTIFVIFITDCDIISAKAERVVKLDVLKQM